MRHRTIRAKGCLSNKTALAMVFKLAEAAQKSWRRLDGHNQLPKVILGVKFNDGIEVAKRPTISPSRRLTLRPSPRFGDSSWTCRASTSFSASTQKAAYIVIETRHNSTRRVAQSSTTTSS